MDSNLAGPTQQIPLQPHLQTPPNNPSPFTKFLWLFLAILIMVTVGSTAYFLGKNQTKQTPIIQSSPTPIPTPDPTANWKIYTNKSDNYSLKYPRDWKVISEDVQSDSVTKRTTLQSIDFVISEPRGMGILGALKGTKLEVAVSRNDNFKSYQQLKDFHEIISTGFPLNFFSTSSQITIDGLPAMLKNGGKLDYGGIIDFAYTFASGKTTEFTFTSENESSEVFKQILSTFKFTDSSSDFFEIKELGIKIKTNDDLIDLDYRIINNSAWFSTKTLENYDSYCSASKGALGTYSIINKSDLTDSDPNAPWWHTAAGLKNATKDVAEASGNIIPATAKEFMNFYLLYIHPQATCSNDKLAQNLETKQSDSLRSAVMTACTPRPACLDATPRCLMAETSDMCHE